MKEDECVEHNGVIQSIDNEMIKVSLIVEGGCVGCKLKSACGASESAERVVDAISDGKSYRTGETVNVALRSSLGYFAVFLSYIVPLLLIFATLIITSYIAASDLVKGLSALLILVPYFLLLYLFRKRLRQTYSFRINKI